ncbi:MAG: hypothetical protein US67_C0077G0004 [Candidatus Woesebacteria bacterium GW2011_GWD1_38_10]|uniref:DUF1269 domain-containing protein n=1 Tax=Candidatus Woesebacteria bacterium GW2011_GWD1_38_10 TaxID=1618592 RepID=A0A0G0HTS3_9BACT|nr:MAG: hypothetical protein US67_C0077G0004 [Candidatus Woesebacteria bacterium GW2011_GWD1_38_10]HAP37954.1 hypothetical protein [Candidatus Shapirobacteria bacterium]HBP51376.1 hypothetical protein [Candidatus Shapirobacteria bacterium]
MNKMLVIAFNTEEDAYEGLNALKDLDKKGDISLYATAVVIKDFTGKVTVRQAEDQGPLGTAVGMLTGAVVGALGGPVGMAVGSSAGGLTGAMFDIGDAGVNADFVDEVSKVLLPGKTVVLAEVDEEWVTPIDTKMAQFDGIIFRRAKSEVIEDQLFAESEAFNMEIQELQTKLKDKGSETKAAAKNTIKSIQKRLESNIEKANSELNKIKTESAAKIDALEAKLKNADDKQKATIEKRIAEVKADKKVRSEKLQASIKLAKEALMP